MNSGTDLSAQTCSDARPGFSTPLTFFRAPVRQVRAVRAGQVAVVSACSWEDQCAAETRRAAAALRSASAWFGAEVEANPSKDFIDLRTLCRYEFQQPLAFVDLGQVEGPRKSAVTRRLSSLARQAYAKQAGFLVLASTAQLTDATVSALKTSCREGPVVHVCLTGRLPDSSPGSKITPDVFAGLSGYLDRRVMSKWREAGARLMLADDLAGGSDELQQIVGACAGAAVHVSVDASIVDYASAPGRQFHGIGGLQPKAAFAVADRLSECQLRSVDVGGLIADADPSGRTAALLVEMAVRLLGRQVAEVHGGLQ